MGHWALLREILKSPIKFGDFTGRQINYIPDHGCMNLAESDTGWSEVQPFSTDLDYKWYPFIHEEKIYLIADGLTKDLLWLSGQIGYENGINSQEKIARLYGNYSLEARGIGLTLEIFNAMPKHLQDMMGAYWICNRCDFRSSSDQWFGLKLVGSGNVNDYHLYCSSGSMNNGRIAVRPLVILEPDTEVYIIDGSDEPLEIRASQVA